MIQIIDLFCGGGGFTKGCIDAGHKPILCVDNWDKAIEFHEFNFPDIPILNLKLGNDIEETASIFEKYVNRDHHLHIHGSPPCQELSNASNHNSSDGYIMVRWFLKLVEYMKPNSWSMENVLPVAHFLEKDSIPYFKINAANFGVPQTRKRIFAGQGWNVKETHKKENWVSIIEALPHLEGELNEIVNLKIKKRSINDPIRSITSKIPSQTRIVSRTKNNPVSIRDIKLEALGSNGKRQNDRSIDEPSKTICGSGNQVGARIFNHKNKNEFEKIRSLTPNETLILQGWKNAKIPAINKSDLFQIIGNMVCPPVAKAIIEGIKLNHSIDFDRTFNTMKFEQIKLF